MQICSHQIVKLNFIEETQSLGLHGMLIAQGFVMHNREISNRGSDFKVFQCEIIVYFSAR